MTVLAVKNGVEQPSGRGVLQTMDDKASGLGIARFNKQERTVTFECWPYLADPTQEGTQFEGWPVTVRVEDNFLQASQWFLPTLKLEAMSDLVVQVIDDENDEIVYTLRMSGDTYRPPVPKDGRYLVKVILPDGHVVASPDQQAMYRENNHIRILSVLSKSPASSD